MYTILCYGDSNTWGYRPDTGGRYSIHERWPGVLRDALGDGYHVIEEGLNGRTTVHDDPFQPGRNGLVYLGPCLRSHAPLELVVLMLGTNDLKPCFSTTEYEIAKGISVLVEQTLHSGAGPAMRAPAILLIAPPLVAPLPAIEAEMPGATARSRQFARHFRAVADLYGCRFLDAAQVVEPSPLDGAHLDREEQRKLGLAVAEVVRQMRG